MTLTISSETLPEALCNAHTRRGTLCQRPAGWGTHHAGSGKCKLHGGASDGRPVTHGRYSVKHRKALATKLQTYLADPAPGDLTAELALMRALLQDYLERLPAGDDALSLEQVGHIMSMAEDIARLVERIARILNSTALTQAEVQYLQARIGDLINKYIDDPQKRLAFVQELRASIERPEARGI